MNITMLPPLFLLLLFLLSSCYCSTFAETALIKNCILYWSSQQVEAVILNLYFANTVTVKPYACNKYVCLNDRKRFVCPTNFSPWLFSSLLREVCRRAGWGRVGVGGGEDSGGRGRGYRYTIHYINGNRWRTFTSYASV